MTADPKPVDVCVRLRAYSNPNEYRMWSLIPALLCEAANEIDALRAEVERRTWIAAEALNVANDANVNAQRAEAQAAELREALGSVLRAVDELNDPQWAGSPVEVMARAAFANAGRDPPASGPVSQEAVAMVCDRMLTVAIGPDWRKRAPEAVTAFWMSEVREAMNEALARAGKGE